MTILDRYYGTRLLAALLKTTLALVMLFMLIDLLTTRKDQIVRNDIPWSLVAYYYAMSIPQILAKYQIGALAMLAAALLVLGNAAQNNEVTAALGAGIPLVRLVRAPVFLAMALAVVMFFVQDTVGVAANQRLDHLYERYFTKKLQTKRPGVSWARLSGKWTCHIMKFNRLALTGEDVFIHSRGEGPLEQIEARRIFWDPDTRRWMIEDGWWSVMAPDTERTNVVERITRRPAPFKEPPEELFALEDSPDTKTAGELLADIHRGESYGVPVNASWTDFHAKFSQPALCAVMIWLAIPFAMRLRKGGLAIGFGVSVAIGLAYLIVFQVAMALGHLDRLPPPMAAWFANAVFLALGLVLFRKTAT